MSIARKRGLLYPNQARTELDWGPGLRFTSIFKCSLRRMAAARNFRSSSGKAITGGSAGAAKPKTNKLKKTTS